MNRRLPWAESCCQNLCHEAYPGEGSNTYCCTAIRQATPTLILDIIMRSVIGNFPGLSESGRGLRLLDVRIEDQYHQNSLKSWQYVQETRH